MSGKFCPSCGVPRKENAKFCASCGQSFVTGAIPPPIVADSVAVPSSPPVVASQPPALPPALPPPQPSQSSPSAKKDAWKVIVGNQLPPTVTGFVGMSGKVAKAPSRPSLRGQVITLLIMGATDLMAALATQDHAARKLAWLRVSLTGVSVVGGMIAGPTRGFFSRLTMFTSLILAVVQSTSLYDFGRRILQNPGMLGGILPNVITQSLSFLTACRTAWAARK